MSDRERPSICPVLRRMFAAVAQGGRSADLSSRGRLIDRLTDLEREGVASGAPRHTLETIRAVRLQARIESLLPRTASQRGR